jgi:hypothetical protein
MDLPCHHCHHCHHLLTREAEPRILRTRQTMFLPRHRFNKCLRSKALLKTLVARETVAHLYASVHQELVLVVKPNAAFQTRPPGVLLFAMCTLHLCLPPQLASSEAALVALAINTNTAVCIARRTFFNLGVVEQQPHRHRHIRCRRRHFVFVSLWKPA